MRTVDWVSDEHNTQLTAHSEGMMVAEVVPIDIGGEESWIIQSFIRDLNHKIFSHDELIKAKELVEIVIKEMKSLDTTILRASRGALRTTDLRRVKGLIKVKKLAELAGLNPNTIASKVARDIELTVRESQDMTKALSEAGVMILG